MAPYLPPNDKTENMGQTCSPPASYDCAIVPGDRSLNSIRPTILRIAMLKSLSGGIQRVRAL